VLLLLRPSFAGGRSCASGGGVTAAGSTVAEPGDIDADPSSSSVEESSAALSPFSDPDVSPDEDAEVERRELARCLPLGGVAGTAHSDIANNPGSGVDTGAGMGTGTGADAGVNAVLAASAKDPVDKLVDKGAAAMGAPEGGATLWPLGRCCSGSEAPLLPSGASPAATKSSWSTEPLPDRLR
jgi:hypothetical protein